MDNENSISVISFISDRDRQILLAAEEGVPMCAEAEARLEILDAMCTKGISFLGKGDWYQNGVHIAVKKIGQELHEIGGMAMMQGVAYRLYYGDYPIALAELGWAWDGIGDWQA